MLQALNNITALKIKQLLRIKAIFEVETVLSSEN
jgi:hypothetical protein